MTTDTLTDARLREMIAPESCLSDEVKVALRELLARREGPHNFGEERCADCDGQLELVCPSYRDRGACFRNVHG